MQELNLKQYDMEYVKLSLVNFSEQLPQKPGIYKIIALDDNNKPETICRVYGNDKEGVLYIGQSSKQTIQHRIGDFWKAHNNEYLSDAHSGARTYASSKKIYERYKFNDLGVWFEVCNNPEGRETEELENYFDEFGELPPLNNKFKVELYRKKAKH